ncbi:MAG TPA: helix-turn-helix domain-containing protein [Jiangellales bacterium]|nr:helix-turn-helix domain-containing protein [Jiangellales bacterium]
MEARELIRPDPPAPAMGESRSRVLAAVQDSPEPVGVGRIAARLRVHANTVRFHLDALVRAGLVERVPEQRRRPGRPRNLYAVRAESSVIGLRSYRLLAEILAGFVAANLDEPAKAAVEAGRTWGRFLAEPPPPYRRVDDDSAVEQLTRTLTAIGFAPETRAGRTRQIRLHHCPFREVAQDHRDVVCAIHLGLMQGLLAELGASVDAERLEPFVEPNLCIAHLAARADGAEA